MLKKIISQYIDKIQKVLNRLPPKLQHELQAELEKNPYIFISEKMDMITKIEHYQISDNATDYIYESLTKTFKHIARKGKFIKKEKPYLFDSEHQIALQRDILTEDYKKSIQTSLRYDAKLRHISNKINYMATNYSKDLTNATLMSIIEDIDDNTVCDTCKFTKNDYNILLGFCLYSLYVPILEHEHVLTM